MRIGVFIHFLERHFTFILEDLSWVYCFLSGSNFAQGLTPQVIACIVSSLYVWFSPTGNIKTQFHNNPATTVVEPYYFLPISLIFQRKFRPLMLHTGAWKRIVIVNCRPFGRDPPPLSPEMSLDTCFCWMCKLQHITTVVLIQTTEVPSVIHALMPHFFCDQSVNLLFALRQY